MSGLHPAFVLFATAVLATMLRHRLRQMVLVLGTLLALLVHLQWSPQTGRVVFLPAYGLQLLYVDALSHVFGLIFTLMTCLGVCYALHVKRGGEHAATLVYAGAAVGVVLAGDWLSLFVFWELMAVASLFVVWYGDTPRSGAAGLRYLLVHILGGALLFCGILLHLEGGAEPTIRALTAPPATSEVAFWLILLGITLNAAVPPLHAWLTDAYPEASVTGSVFLSAFTTKTAIYVLIRLFPGLEILVWAGVAMALYGVVYAVLENDTRRLLAYHIISQVGYMVAGVGMGSAMALNGAVAHAFCHILYKAVLFMGAGAVIEATDRRKLTDLGGIGRHMPLVVVLYMVGAFSISGVPLFNGFISKSMVITAATESQRPVMELLLILASIGTFLHTGLKLPYFTFFAADRGLRPRPIPWNMLLAMGGGAVLCIALGLFPGWLYARLPLVVEYHPYTADHIVSALELLLGTGLGFWMLLAKLSPEPLISLDTDWLYRKLLGRGLSHLITAARQTGEALEAWRAALLHAAMPYLQNPFLALPRPGPAPLDSHADAAPTNRLPIGVTIFWIVVFFTAVALYTL